VSMSALSSSSPAAIADWLRGRIQRGELVPGDRLPPERDLASELAVARPTLRRALLMLKRDGYLRAERGAAGGTFVSDLTSPMTSWMEGMQRDRERLEALMDFRVAVECRAAELAAGRRSERHVEELYETITAVEAAAGMSDFRRADATFHHVIGEASGNRFLLDAILDARGELFSPIDGVDYELDLVSTADGHRKVAEALRDRDPVRAVSEMRDHMEITKAEMRIALFGDR